MLKRADLRLKRCFGQTEAPCRKSLKSGWPNAKMTKACSSRVENAVLYRKVYRFVLARDQHVLSLLHWMHHFLTLFSKVHEFVPVQNSVFSPRSACFVIFPLGPALFSDFQQSTSACPKHRFQPEISTYCQFCTECTTF